MHLSFKFQYDDVGKSVKINNRMLTLHVVKSKADTVYSLKDNLKIETLMLFFQFCRMLLSNYSYQDQILYIHILL